MDSYHLLPESISYNYASDNQYTDTEIIFWAEEVNQRLEEEYSELTLLVDRPERVDYIGINEAIDILASVGEYLEPINP